MGSVSGIYATLTHRGGGKDIASFSIMLPEMTVMEKMITSYIFLSYDVIKTKTSVKEGNYSLLPLVVYFLYMPLFVFSF